MRLAMFFHASLPRPVCDGESQLRYAYHGRAQHHAFRLVGASPGSRPGHSVATRVERAIVGQVGLPVHQQFKAWVGQKFKLHEIGNNGIKKKKKQNDFFFI